MTNTIKAVFIGIISNIRNWWNNNHQQVRQDARQAFRMLDRWLDRLSRGVWIMIAIGVILNVASYIYPDLPKRIPILYAWFDGWLQFGEFLIKVALGGLYALFTGNFSGFWAECDTAIHEMLHQFTQWLSTIHF